MKFKRFRYNLIVFGLVAIVGCCVSLPVITGGESSINQGSSLEDVLEPIPEDEIELGMEEEINDEELDEEESFADMSDVELISYAMDKLYNGKGYSSVVNHTVITTAAGMTVPQYVKGTIVRNGKDSLQEYYYYSSYSGIGSESLKKYYEYNYINRAKGTYAEGISYTYDQNAMTHGDCSVTNMTYQDAMDKYLIFWGDSFPVGASRKNGDSFIKDEIDKSGKYRTIVVQNNISKLPKCIKDSFSITGQLKGINYSDYTVTYKINIKTGKVYSISRKEKFSATASGIPVLGTVGTTMEISVTQVFKSVDEEQTIVVPK